MILVVGAVVVDDLERPSRLLAARRSSPPALAGGWEFPGGKVETGEAPLAALQRELVEELQIELDVGREVANPAGGSWPISTTYAMRLWLATITRGTPQPTGSHDEVRWLGSDELFEVDWLPADVAVVAHLRSYLV